MKELNPSSLDERVNQAIEEMKSEQGNHFSPEQINLAELERRTGIFHALAAIDSVAFHQQTILGMQSVLPPVQINRIKNASRITLIWLASKRQSSKIFSFA